MLLDLSLAFILLLLVWSPVESSNATRANARPGVLMCEGKRVSSEVIYWKIVDGDAEYESPISPHHGQHGDRYLTFQFDGAGMNNFRMAMESIFVVAHAMGRTLVMPAPQHLFGDRAGGEWLKKEDIKEEHKGRLGLEDMFEFQRLYQQKGFHAISMEQFLEKEGVTGGLHGVLPPGNSTQAWGHGLWEYLNNTADAHPQWGLDQGPSDTKIFVAFPDKSGSPNFPKLMERMNAFGGREHRTPVFYDDNLQQAHHIHFPAWPGNFRVLEQFYGKFHLVLR
jgi:hypothetical protein